MKTAGGVSVPCAADLGVRRALFAALAGDTELLDTELTLTDGLLDELKSLLSLPNDLIDPSGRASPQGQGMSPLAFFQAERNRLRFDAERALAVAATAAWFGHDDSRAARYLPYAEAHARAILEEHLALVSGAKRIPEAEYSPSDFSKVDMEFFRSIERDSAESTLKKMRDLSYAEPARLAELFGGGRAPQTREALARWVREGFVKASPASGLFELLKPAFAAAKPRAWSETKRSKPSLPKSRKSSAEPCGTRAPTRPPRHSNRCSRVDATPVHDRRATCPPMLSIAALASRNVSDTLAIAMEHTGEHAAVVVADERTELSRLLVRAYVECLPGARVLMFDNLEPVAVRRALEELGEGALAVLIQPRFRSAGRQGGRSASTERFGVT